MSSSKRLQRDRATPTVSIPSRFMNSRHNAQYLPSYHFDKKLYMSFRLVPMSVTLNGEMALILRYFTQFGNCPYFALFHRNDRIRVLASVLKSTF